MEGQPRKSYSKREIAAFARQFGRSRATIWSWLAQGCDFENAESVEYFLARKPGRRPKAGSLVPKLPNPSSNPPPSSNSPLQPSGNGEKLAPHGKKGAAAALERLEAQEERAHARLEAALASTNPQRIAAAQDFWLKCSETLRRLDLAVEIARRNEETQIPLKVAEQTATSIAEWLRIAFLQFLSSETTSLIGINDVGEFKTYAIERFKGIVDLTVRSADKTASPVPDWAKERIKIAWNVS
jgi:hypothetical protein